MSKKTYCFSTDGEEFAGEFDTIEEALLEAVQPHQQACLTVYVGENKPFKPSIDGVEAIEAMQQQAYNAIGDIAEIYLEDVHPDDIEKLGDMLTDTFNRWAKETGNEPNIFEAVNVKEFPLVGKILSARNAKQDVSGDEN